MSDKPPPAWPRRRADSFPWEPSRFLVDPAEFPGAVSPEAWWTARRRAIALSYQTICKAMRRPEKPP